MHKLHRLYTPLYTCVSILYTALNVGAEYFMKILNSMWTQGFIHLL